MKYYRFIRSLSSWVKYGFISAVRGKHVFNVSCGAKALGFVNRLELPSVRL